MYRSPPATLCLTAPCLRQVAAGSDLFISVWNLHRSPAIWERPNEFQPDRFPVDGPTPTEVTHNFAYLPFGGGRRKCIGACRPACLVWPRRSPTVRPACLHGLAALRELLEHGTSSFAGAQRSD